MEKKYKMSVEIKKKTRPHGSAQRARRGGGWVHHMSAGEALPSGHWLFPNGYPLTSCSGLYLSCCELYAPVAYNSLDMGQPNTAQP